MIIGDFNAHNPLWGRLNNFCSRGRSIDELMMENGLSLFGDREPSRLDSGYTVDFGIGNLPVLSVKTKTKDSSIRTDHQAISFGYVSASNEWLFRSEESSPGKSFWSIKSMDKFEWDCVCELISRDWYISSHGHSLEDKLRFLYDLLMYYAEIHIPKHTYSENSKPYWTPQLTRLRKERNYLKRRYEKSDDEESKEKLREKEKEYSREQARCKEARIDSLVYEQSSEAGKQEKPNVFKLMNKLKKAKMSSRIAVSPDEIIEFYASIGSDSEGIELEDMDSKSNVDDYQEMMLNEPIRYDEVCFIYLFYLFKTRFPYWS